MFFLLPVIKSGPLIKILIPVALSVASEIASDVISQLAG